MSRKAPVIVSCPACEGDVRFRKAPYLGQYKICAECDTELEVVSLSPVEVDYLEDEFALEDNDYGDEMDEFDELDEEEEYADYYRPQTEPERRPISQPHSFEFDD